MGSRPGHRTRKIALGTAALAAAAAAVVVLLVPGAEAHSRSILFHGTWSTSSRGAVAIYAETSLSGAALSRVLGAAKTWDTLGESLNFTWKGAKNLSRDPCDATVRGRNLIRMGPLDGKGKDLAMTTICRSGGTIVRFVTVFDSAEPWYTGTSTIVPRGRPDLSSVAVHEFGHAAGWADHFDDPEIGLGSGICGNFSGQHTMCATHFSGTARQRSLGPHDVDTFRAAY